MQTAYGIFSAMTVALNLPKDLEEFVEQAVKSGRFLNEEELMREALEALKTQEEFRQFQFAGLKEKLQQGLDDLEGGRVEEWDGEAVKRKGRAIHAVLTANP